MTREEAIAWFKNSPFYNENHEPYIMAIEALQADAPSDQYLKGFEDAKRAYDIELYRRPQEELLTHEQAWAEIGRPHGEWLLDKEKDETHCSVCGANALLVAVGVDVGLEEYSNFCPNCGADMRGEQTNIIKDTAESVERLKDMGILEDRKFPFHDEIMEKLDKLTLKDGFVADEWYRKNFKEKYND